jgi:hypothetical protein
VLENQENNARVMIELSTNYEILMNRLIKFHQSINHAFSENLNSELFIKPLLQSLLYIFKSRESFERIHHPIPKLPEFFKKIAFRIDEKSEETILGNTLKDENSIPKDGIRYYMYSKSHDVKDLFETLRRFYTSVHPEIKVELFPDHIEIIFNSFNAVRRNFEFTYYVVKKVLKSRKMTLEEIYHEIDAT